jgi:CubicO group peptidase (beta-lactamase class C family)
VKNGAAAGADTLFLLFSQTKVLTSSAVWALVEEGKLSFMDKITDHLPEFKAHGKADITLHTVMTHQAGYPSGDVTQATWTDHAKMRAEVCDFSLDWTPGSRLQYHPRAAHLTQAMVIEAVTGQDYRDVIRDKVLAPLGLAEDIFVGVPLAKQGRCADTGSAEGRDNSPEFKAAGMPSGGGYATARGIAAFYQMLLGKGRLGNVRMFSPRLVEYVTRSHTGDRGDHAMDGIPMHRGLGPHVRGDSERIRGLGTIGAPQTFGHGGAGTSYSWADPTSGVSFTYLTNYVQPDPWHSMRLDRVANLVHAAID